MPTRLEHEAALIADRVARGDPYWPAQATVAAAILIYLALPDPVTVGPTWLMPIVEGVLLVTLVVVAPSRATERVRGIRHFALAVIGLVSVVNIVSLVLLVHFLIAGGAVHGDRLIASGALLWLTNVLMFGVWYWELDRGGPVARFERQDGLVDFLFPQMGDERFTSRGWRPGYVDYLYTSLTNATAFSPTDTMPVTHTAKAVMALQSVSALVTVGLVVARAVNILG
jgi:uncharacterized membrane protein